MAADEKYAASTLQSLEDTADTAEDYARLDRARRLLALSTRLFGGFRRDVTLEYLPPAWDKNIRPREPFGYERVISQLMDAAGHRNAISGYGECTYWFCRGALFAAFENVERIRDGASANRGLSAQFAEVEKLTSDIQSKLFDLQVTLEELHLVDIPEKTFPIHLIEDESLAKRHREPADEHLWRIKPSYRLHELMDPRQIGHIAEWCRALEEESERLKFETRNPAGAPARFDRLYFMHVVGLLWLFITGAAPTLSSPEQYSPIVPFESSPCAAAAGLPGRAPEDRRRVIADTSSDGRKGDFGDQAEGDNYDTGSASTGADGVGHFQRNGHRPQDGAQIHRARP
ncbi:hypothetical protein [Martelella endophytica]|uniref:hypothetical protein n=1 Tax=Martelella endophytica TaxID=1486262 RepID=UPI001FCD1C07|nr:hypothetical protein [Martelella endophytica]